MFHSLFFMVENLRICNLQTAYLKICGFAICCSIKEICRFEIFGLTYLRYLQIFYCKLSPRICGFEICGFKKTFACPLLQIFHHCQPYWRQICRQCHQIRKFLKKFKMVLMGCLGTWGKLIHEKT
jgi:hypothetical protein